MSDKHVATSRVVSERLAIAADLCGMHSRQAARRLTQHYPIVAYTIEQRDPDTEPSGPCDVCAVVEATGLPLSVSPLEHAPGS